MHGNACFLECMKLISGVSASLQPGSYFKAVEIELSLTNNILHKTDNHFLCFVSANSSVCWLYHNESLV